uniref:Uncharacterized protein n=1 Tax=uncultured alpha proteobacterium EB000_37G09 TaxID=710792 RepID=E0XZI2_9PROT|nr:hypothetical protein [uncultured alpha proteobacterium EB000_37G09]
MRDDDSQKTFIKTNQNKIVIKLFDLGVKFFVPLLQRQKIKLALLYRPAIIIFPF